mgnify:CR=1 FL=1
MKFFFECSVGRGKTFPQTSWSIFFAHFVHEFAEKSLSKKKVSFFRVLGKFWQSFFFHINYVAKKNDLFFVSPISVRSGTGPLKHEVPCPSLRSKTIVFRYWILDFSGFAMTDISWVYTFPCSGATYKLRNAIFRTFPTFCKKSEVIRADDRDEKLETQKSYDCVESLWHGTSCFKENENVWENFFWWKSYDPISSIGQIEFPEIRFVRCYLSDHNFFVRKYFSNMFYFSERSWLTLSTSPETDTSLERLSCVTDMVPAFSGILAQFLLKKLLHLFWRVTPRNLL